MSNEDKLRRALEEARVFINKSASEQGEWYERRDCLMGRIKEALAATQEQRGEPERWQPIEDHPAQGHDCPRVIVWGSDTGVQMGHVYRYRADETPRAVAEGFNGNWNITQWQPLPSPPTDAGKGAVSSSERDAQS